MAKLSERVQEQQARRTRRPLPPSHPRESSGESAASGQTNPATAQVIDLTSAASSAHDAQAEPAPAAEENTNQPERSQVSVAAPVPSGAVGERSIVRRKTKARSEPDVAVPLEPRQVWLDRENDLWLSECEYANVRRGGRKVISRSSVVRLALDRLREAMTPEQITELLAGREPTQSGRGRPRR
jgi:hypothetical protein